MDYLTVIEKLDKSCKNIKTNHLIVLCEIGDEYKSFCDDLEKLIKSKGNKNLVSKAYNAMQGKTFIGSSKYKNFIEKHRHTIEIMNKYSCLGNLTVLNYDAKGNREKNLSEDYYYQYIQEHKEDIEAIKAVALKIKNLGIDKINFSEELDFTEIEYQFDDLWREYGFAFLENMEVNPTYLNTRIKYKTNGSCYCLILGSNSYGSNKKISKYKRNIILNSLIFDPNRLPNEITIESTIGLIYELSTRKKSTYEDIRNSVDLSISTSDLKEHFEYLKAVIEKIDKIKDNKELVILLKQMQNILTQLQLFGVNFEKEIINSHTDVTDEIMKKEKKLYLDRRHYGSIDFC